MTKISVIIPVYNEEKDIGKCIDSLGEQSLKDFEIIIVDDGSTDKTKEIARKYKKVKLVYGEHKGTAFSRNLGVEKSDGDILIFVDADMTFDKDYLENLVKPILENGNIVGTTHENEIAMNTNNIWSRCWGKVRVSKEGAKGVKIFRAIRKNKFLEMGGFDSKYGYADDQTFWFKFKVKPEVAPNTICYHNNPETLEETFKQAKWIGASWKERFGVFRIWCVKYIALGLLWALLPFLVFMKVLGGKIESVSFRNKIRFFWVKFYGYFVGIKKAVLSGEVWK